MGRNRAVLSVEEEESYDRFGESLRGSGQTEREASEERRASCGHVSFANIRFFLFLRFSRDFGGS